MKQYKSILKQGESYLNEKSSKFFAFAFPVPDEETVSLNLKHLKQLYPDANHHCYAFILGAEGQQQKSSDDGEPSGSAGKPILNALLSQGVTDVLVVVVRYFGGKQLGVRGLIDAYQQAAIEAVKEAEVFERPLTQSFRFHYRYEQEPLVQRLWKKLSLKPKEHIPDLTGNLVTVWVPVSISADFREEVKLITNEVETGSVR